jgi:spiro-SPASM protein
MPPNVFDNLLAKIENFSGDAVIDISLWGEAALHPQKMELIKMVLARPALSLIIETSGIGWKQEELQELADLATATLVADLATNLATNAQPRINRQPALSWIVSLDAHDPLRYQEIRGAGFTEANACAKMLLELFPESAYVQAVRVKGFEDDIEHFYRAWKAAQNNERHIIIQKYDDFAGALPKLQASDLSPVQRRACWHIQRDMNILLDGTVPCCKEDLAAIKGSGGKPVWGNAFTEELSAIWERGGAIYREHCAGKFSGICANCDEYYTFNF